MGGMLILFVARRSRPSCWPTSPTGSSGSSSPVTVGFGADRLRRRLPQAPSGATRRASGRVAPALAVRASAPGRRRSPRTSLPGTSSTVLDCPFFKDVQPDLGLFYIPFAVLVVVGASNAVNLTDGLDGLAIGPVMIAGGTYAVLAYATGHARIAEYLQIPYIAGRRRAGGLLRRDGRRRPRLPLVQRLPGAGLHGRRRLAGARRRARHARGAHASRRSCCSSSAASSSSRRCR